MCYVALWPIFQKRKESGFFSKEERDDALSNFDPRQECFKHLYGQTKVMQDRLNCCLL